MRNGARVVAGITVAAGLSCIGETQAPARVEVTDSAGVRVVTNQADAPARRALDGDPLRVLPASADDGVTLFRVEGGVLLPDGGVVLANAGNHELLYFAASGELERSVGGEGDGPGEFRGISWLEARADGGVAVGDSRVRRVTAFGSEGALLWSRRFDPAFDEDALPPNALVVNGSALSALEDGALVGYPRAVATPRGSRGPLPLEADFALYPPDTLGTEEPRPLGRRTVINWYEDPSQEGPPVAGVLGAPRIWWAGHSGRFALTEAIEPRVEVFDGGRLTLVLRERRGRTPFEPDSIPRDYAVAVDSLPAYQDIRVDGLHRIWARLTLEEDPARWRVFDASGVTVADVMLPSDARVLDADRTRLLLLRRDELDVESVALHRFELPEG